MCPRVCYMRSMGKTPTSSFRLPSELLERVDEYAAELARNTGLRVSRAGAVVKLLTSALDSEDARKRKRKA